MKATSRAILLCALLSSHCGGGEPSEPSAETSVGAETRAEPPPPLPAPVEGTFKLPVRLPHTLIADLVNGELPQHQADGFQQVTPPGRSPDLQAAYDIWRDPVRVSFSDSTLHLEVPLRYAARFNARVKNPFGGKWMTVARNEAWGTPEHPLRVTVRLHSRITISPDWQLTLATKVDPPEHGPPPSGKICTGGAFKLCVTKASVAPQVQRQIDAEVRNRIGKAAADFDRTAPSKLALRQRVQRIYRRLVEPKATEHGRFMTLAPRQAALSLRAEPGAVVVEPAVFAQLAYHDQRPRFSAPALPLRSAISALPDEPLTLPDAFLPAELQLLLQAP